MNLILNASIVLLLLGNPSEANHLRQTQGSRYLKKQTHSTRTLNSKAAKSAKSAAKIATVASWDVVVNNADVIPPPETPRRSLQEVEEKTFSSYNAASVNAAKDVVFRARSTG